VSVFAVDTCCMVAAVCTWHEHHDAAIAAIESRLDRGEKMAIAAHAIAEAYAVLTRLPAPHRLSPPDAWAVLKGSFVDHASLSVLGAAHVVRLLSHLAGGGVAGGRTYDAIIAETAAAAKVSVLLTFNTSHFDPPPPGITVIDPTREA